MFPIHFLFRGLSGKFKLIEKLIVSCWLVKAMLEQGKFGRKHTKSLKELVEIEVDFVSISGGDGHDHVVNNNVNNNGPLPNPIRLR